MRMSRSAKGSERSGEAEAAFEPERAILHVDMDAFYASVEERENPALVGQPVIVGGSPEGRGVVAAANYPARAYGVHSAMPAARARQLCPHAVFIRSRLDFYADISRQVRAIFDRYTPLVEPLSLDEAFLDVTSSRRLFGSALEIAQDVKGHIKREVSLVASVGIAPNKFLAKLASDLDKPDGLVSVPCDAIQAFLDPLPVSRLWGVGRVAKGELNRVGIHTIRELRGQPAAVLAARFGKWGEHLWELAHGRDSRAVTPDHAAKSISHETTFAHDITDPAALRAWLFELAEQVTRRLRRQGLLARTVELKLRYADFRTVTRSRSLADPSNASGDFWAPLAELFDAQFTHQPGSIRLLGAGVSGLGKTEPRQPDLFEEDSRQRQGRLDEVVDEVSRRFGNQAIVRAGGARIRGGRKESGDPDGDE